jgi:cyanophycin synthetase
VKARVADLNFGYSCSEMMSSIRRDHSGLLERARISLLCLYYVIVRRSYGRIRPKNRRLRTRLNTLGKNFHIRMWREAAEAVGARCTAENDGVVEIERGDRKIQVQDNVTSLSEPDMVKRAANKAGMLALLARSGIAVPKGIVIQVGEFERAVHMLQAARCPLVVKPAGSTCGGAGVSTNVTNVTRLRAAVAWARTFGRQILIEEQIEGDCYRVLVVDGKVIDTIVRYPPRVVGDGVSTIRRLIHRENELRLEAATEHPQVLIRFDVDLQNTLATQGLQLSSRPGNGEVVVLKQVINDNSERENLPANGRLCPAILEAACKAADIVGARLAGIDVICTNPGVPLEESGGAIIEVNATPGFHFHCRDGVDAIVPVANRILSRIFDLAAQHQ